MSTQRIALEDGTTSPVFVHRMNKLAKLEVKQASAEVVTIGHLSDKIEAAKKTVEGKVKVTTFRGDNLANNLLSHGLNVEFVDFQILSHGVATHNEQYSASTDEIFTDFDADILAAKFTQ